MVKKLVFLTLAVLTLGLQAFAQNVVTGKVVDAKGEPVAAAGVQVKGTNIGVVTDLDGNFRINAGSNANLVISSIGYKTATVPVGNRSVINVTLEDDSLLLDDVVVVGYGTARRKDLTGAITAVDGNAIAVQQQGSVTRALEGQVAGLQVSSLDGQPGLDMGIRIRGIGTASANNSNALIIIDGSPAIDGINPLSSLNSKDIESVTVLKDAASTAMYGSRGANGVILITTKSGKAGKVKVSFQGRWGVNTLGGNAKIKRIGQENPGDLYEYTWETIYNAAYYGYATDGAALKGNDKASREFASAHLFDYTGSATSFSRNALGNWMVYQKPSGMNITPTGSGVNQSGTMSGTYLVGTDGKLAAGLTPLYSGGTAKDELYSDRFRQEYNVTASGGTEKMDYHLSVGMLSDPSYVKQSGFNRYTARANVNAWITDWLKVGAKFGYTNRTIRSQATRYGRNPGAATQNIFYWIQETLPLLQVYQRDQNGNFVTNADGDRIVQMAYATTYAPNTGNSYSPFGYTSALSTTNLVLFPEQSYDNQKWDDLNIKGYARVTFLKDFSAEINISYDNTFGNRKRFFSGESAAFIKSYAQLGQSALTSIKSTYSTLTTQQLLNYNRDFEKHHVDALLGHEFYEYNYDETRYASANGLLPNYGGYANFVGTVTYGSWSGANTGAINKMAMESYFGRANYIYDEKYYLSASLRRDGSSKFKKPENRWGTFWSVGAGWRISSEPWMDGTNDWLDNLKIRASYGVIGNQNGVDMYSGYQRWSYGGSNWQYFGGNGSNVTSGLYAGATTLSKSAWVNDALTWENVHTTDAGIDFTLFGGKLAGSFDWFNKNTVNALWDQNASYLAAGQATLKMNTASMRSRGVELELNWQPVKTKDWDVIFSTNGTHYNTIITSVPESQGETWTGNADSWSLSGGGSSSAGVGMYTRGVGKDYYNLHLYKYGGVAGNTGKTFYDDNNAKQTGFVAGNSAMGKPLFWHKVTEAEATAGTYPGAAAGDDILTTKTGAASLYEVGDAIPEWIGGFTTNVRFRSFDLTVMLAYQIGGKFLSVEYANGQYRGSNGSSISQELFGNTWSENNKDAKFPMPVYGRNGDYRDGATIGSWAYTDMALFDASYLSLKNVTLGYTLPEKLVRKAKLSGLRVFASADNPILLFSHSGVDPRWSLVGGMEVGAAGYPYLGVYTFGVDINF